jgi:hypothetical protein
MKQMNRNGITMMRKRVPNAGRDANAVRGVVVNWQQDELEVQRLINQYLDATDQRQLLLNADISYTNNINSH